MILFFLDILDSDPLAAFVFFGALVTALIAGISFHEFSHAYVADLLGDRLPRSRGRVRLRRWSACSIPSRLTGLTR